MNLKILLSNLMKGLQIYNGITIHKNSLIHMEKVYHIFKDNLPELKILHYSENIQKGFQISAFAGFLAFVIGLMLSGLSLITIIGAVLFVLKNVFDIEILLNPAVIR